MTFKERYEQIKFLLDERRLHEAFHELGLFIASVPETDMGDELERMKAFYRNLIHYTREDAEDPERYKMFDHLLAQTYTLNDQVLDKVNEQSSMDEYDFVHQNIKRLHKIQSIANHQLLFESFVEDSALNQLLNRSEESKEHLRKHDQDQQQLFQFIWTMGIWNDASRKEAEEFIQSLIILTIDKEIFLSAVMLSLNHAFDENKMIFLLSCLNHPEQEVRIRAIMYFAISAEIYKERLNCYTRLQTALNVLEEKETAHLGVMMTKIIKSWIRQCETERIGKIIQNEIMPQLLQASQDKNLNGSLRFTEEILDKEELPAWEQEKQNKLRDNIQQMSEWQYNGLDTSFSTFKQMKTDSFFSGIAHWFTPFNLNSYHSVLNLSNNEDIETFSNFMTDNAIICNSDLHSLCNILKVIPKESFKAMIQQLKEKDEEIKMLKEANKNTNKEATYIQLHMQDLYRFFFLHPHRKEFKNPFEIKTDLLNNSLIKKLILNDLSQSQEIANLYFKFNHYGEAIHWFTCINELTHGSMAEINQKIGYCYQKQGLYDEAIKAYQIADTIKPDVLYNIRHLAQCYRLKGHFNQALEYYLQAEKSQPDNLNLEIIIGECYLKIKDYENSLKYLFKAQFNYPDSPQALRALAWATLMAGKYEQSKSYYKQLFDLPQRVATFKITSQDYLNAGHLALLTQENSQAINLYIEGCKCHKDIEGFMKLLDDDKAILCERGVTEKEFTLLLEVIRSYAIVY